MSNNFTVKAEAALNKAVIIAEELGHTYIGTEHILLSLSEDETCCASILMKKNKIEAENIRSAIEEYSGKGSKTRLTTRDTTPKFKKVIEHSYKLSKKYSSEKIGSEHILLALLEEKDSVASKILTKIEADCIGLKDNLVVFLRNSGRSITYAEPVTENAIPNLLKYGKNLSALAEKGELDPVIGREKETDRLIRILARRNKNNPCLIGEAGVGKTAIVEGLAQRISTGMVPEGLVGKTVISLDLTSMVAGAKYRGDFEERIKNIMSEVSKNKSIILFIDEIHTIVGAGSAEGAIDAANIMKPELSRGDVQLIGATTLDEYRKYIEKDAALERRFQPVIIEQPDLKGTVEIIKGLKDRFEAHHKVKIDDSAITSSVRLSERYIQDRFLPDKAIDLLDEACALANVFNLNENADTKKLREKIRQTNKKRKNAINNKDFELAINLRELEKLYSDELCGKSHREEKRGLRPVVTEQHVKKILTEVTGIDLGNERREEGIKIYDRLSKEVIGQNSAVKKLSEAVTRSYAGINSPDRPRGIFLFLGESGVGKTELANALSRELFKTDNSLIRYDMSEYSEPSSVTKLLGASPGYVGYDDGTSPIERIRKHPYSVILLDEIEKAHRDVLSLFLQAFDNGYITDAKGRRISFRNSYIIMTSNIGARRDLYGHSTGFISSNSNNGVYKALREHFKDEFINRIDDIIVFSSLDSDALSQIAKLKLQELDQRLALKRINLIIDEDVYDHLAKKAIKQSGNGARPLNRLIVSEVENRIALIVVEDGIEEGQSLVITLDNDEIVCLKQCPALNSAT